VAQILTPDFYNRPVLQVARELVGKRLVRQLDGQRLGGLVLETEAYRGEDDLACHARAGRTPRTEVMYGPPGRAYVYFNYGMYWMLNCVCEIEGYPAAVLIRAIQPVEGLETIAVRRAGRKLKDWTSGPGRLCLALGVDKTLNRCDLTSEQSGLWVEDEAPVPDTQVLCTPRIGIDSVPEPWKSQPWRFVVQGSL
jgi:DNA-3-methyladenine glycosylase